MRLKICVVCFLLLLINTSIVYPSQVKSVLAEEFAEQKEIDLMTSPEKVFFNTSNLKPGDDITKIITIKNTGKQDFTYLFTNKFIRGSKEFYNELLLEVSNNKDVLYRGSLKDFEKLKPRHLIHGYTEELVFTIQIPYELDNEYQGLGSEFQFKLFVEGTLGGVLPVDNKLPTTGSEMFNLLATGASILLAGLILFSYVKRKKLDTKRP